MTTLNGPLPLQRLKLRLPFLTTQPVTDLRLLVVLAPVFWLLGLEQFVATPVLAWALTKHFLQGGRLRFDGLMGALTLLLAAMLVSALFIVEPIRYISFARSFLMYVNGLLTGLLILNASPSWKSVLGTASAVVWSMVLAGLIGLIGILGSMPGEFTSVFGRLLPSIVSETDYGQLIAHRQLGAPSWFQGLGNYFRINSTFLFSTTYAAALAIVIPVAGYFAIAGKTWARIAYSLGFLVLAVNLVYTTGRMSWIALMAAVFITFMWTGPRQARWIRVLLVATSLALSASMIPPGFIADTIDSTLYARGSGSTVSRLRIYEATLQGFMERPVFGWGSERDMISDDGFPYPAGSHSHYLGFLYKHGLIGLAALLGFGALAWFESRSARGYSVALHTGKATVYLTCARCGIIAGVIIAATTVLDLDATLIQVFWMVLFTAIFTGRFLRNQPSQIEGT